MERLNEKIEHLISMRSEGNYWDFKQQWYEKKSDLLLDIICMANNLADHDGYIIIGVTDDIKVCGVEEDSNRRNQQNVIDFLKNKKFAHGCRPTVYIKSIKLDKEIDVIIIKNSKNVPYYLLEDYQGILKYHIYTRIIDTNTSRMLSADFDKVEYLWKKRFGLDLSPFEKAKFLLNDTKSWYPVGTDGIHSSSDFSGEYYHKQFPEFIIKRKICENLFDHGQIDRVEHDIYWMNELPRPLHNTYIYTIELKYLSTVLYSTLAIFADNFRFERTLWKKEMLFVNESNEYIFYCYVEKDSIEYMIDKWLCNSYDIIGQIKENPIIDPLDIIYSEYISNNPYEAILCFENIEERVDFNNYIQSNKLQLLEDIGDYSYTKSSNRTSCSKSCDPEYIEYLCKSGKVLNKWLKQWRLKK